jgi:glycosyltransferase involved in cell wall biosynthesis
LKKIKIVFLMQHLVCGGAEQALYDLICLMDKSKFDISVFVLVGGAVWEEKFKNTGVPVVNVFCRRQKGCSPAQFVKHQLRKARIYSVIHRDSRKLFGMFFPEGADIVVAYSMWGDEAAALPYNTKHVKYIHANVGADEPERKTALKNRDLFPEYQRIICVSDEACRSFKELTGVSENVRQYYNPLNSENVCRLAQQPVELPEDMPYLCAVGRLDPDKGFDRLIRIHKRILEQGVEHKLVIVGDGPDKERLQRTIQETDSGSSVILAGYQINPYPYIKNSRCLVCSSFMEGLPVVSMEALALGVPVVSAVPSIGEIFGGTCCGIVTENDDRSLEAGIRKMLCDDVFYSEAKKAAQERSVFFDGRRMVKKVEDMFIEVMEESAYGSN